MDSRTRRRRTITSLIVVLGTLLTLSQPATAASSATWGTWTMYSQEQGNWCWAAGAKTIVQHERGTSSSECQFVKWGLPSSQCPNSAGTINQMIAAMRGGGLSNPGTGWGGTPSWYDTRTETVAGHGLLIRVLWGPAWSTGHIAPIIGSKVVGSTPYVRLVYIQTTGVSSSWVSWDSFIAGTGGLGGNTYRPTHYVIGMRA